MNQANTDPTLNVDVALNVKHSGYSTAGFAERYDSYRPRPPDVLLDVLTQLARMRRPDCVIDLGSGTGLSTCVWATRACQVVGIEPNDEMRSKAESRRALMPVGANVHFVKGFSHQTNLADDINADIITCAQSLHWMEPTGTFAEVNRVLRPGGVFAAYNYDLPTMDWEVELALANCTARADALWSNRDTDKRHKRWSKDEHIRHMRESGYFRFIKELDLHSNEPGTAERLMGLIMSLGTMSRLLDQGLTEADLGLDELRRVAECTWGSESSSWYFSYHVLIGVK